MACFLWWLVLKHGAITIRQIPKWIWLGLASGCYIAFPATYQLIKSLFLTPATGVTTQQELTVLMLYGLGPLLVLFTVLAVIWLMPARQ